MHYQLCSAKPKGKHLCTIELNYVSIIHQNFQFVLLKSQYHIWHAGTMFLKLQLLQKNTAIFRFQRKKIVHSQQTRDIHPTLCQCRRRWPNIDTTLGEYLVNIWVPHPTYNIISRVWQRRKKTESIFFSSICYISLVVVLRYSKKEKLFLNPRKGCFCSGCILNEIKLFVFKIWCVFF